MPTYSRGDFIALELAPIAGDYADDFDLDAVFDDLYRADTIVYVPQGFRWADEDPDQDAINEALQRHDLGE